MVMSEAKTSISPFERTKRSQNDDQHQPLLPGLPDSIALLSLSLVHPSVLFSVCTSWRRLIYSSVPPFLSLYALFSSSASASSNSIHFYSFNPISADWHPLPQTPPDPPLRLVLRHPSFISRNFPIQSVSAAKEGAVYDVEKDTWQDMPEGMIIGWRGPVAAMDEDVMYVVDEANGALRRYDPNKDVWEEIFESERLRGADQIAAGGGRVCVVCGGEIFVVDVSAATPRLWAVETPSGLEALAIHILPRMSNAD